MGKMKTLYEEIRQEIIDTQSINYDPNCNTCIAHYRDYYPPHYASKNCQSGKHNHCTCDICF